MSSTFFYAALGGILPALLWLWFWLREDRRRPEPRGMIFLTFAVGMAVVPLVIPFEKLSFTLFGETLLTFALWSAIEEFFKYAGAYVIALRSRFLDEPIDAVIYLITAALGFAALENVFFILEPLQGEGTLGGLMIGNLRFIGATLLHTISSAAVGAAIALSFYRNYATKARFLIGGFAAAVFLHTLFNFFIIQLRGNELFYVFGGVWLGVVGLILLFERIKRVKKQR